MLAVPATLQIRVQLYQNWIHAPYVNVPLLTLEALPSLEHALVLAKRLNRQVYLVDCLLAVFARGYRFFSKLSFHKVLHKLTFWSYSDQLADRFPTKRTIALLLLHPLLNIIEAESVRAAVKHGFLRLFRLFHADCADFVLLGYALYHRDLGFDFAGLFVCAERLSGFS